MAKSTAIRSTSRSPLLQAFDFVEVASHGPAVYAPYALFGMGWLTGYDGVVAAGARVAEDCHAAPSVEVMRQALARAAQPYSLTIHTDGDVTVTGDKVRVKAPGFPPAGIPNAQPDRPSIAVTDALKRALIETARIVALKQERVLGCSINLRGNTCVGTNGTSIIEAYHGCNLPARSWLLPKEFTEALSKLKYQPSAAGWSDASFTLWFGDNAWLRCNLYDTPYPDTDVLFAQAIAGMDQHMYCGVPTNTLLAVETLKPFLENKMVYLLPGGLNTREDGLGAKYLLEHSMPAFSTAYDNFRMMAAHAQAMQVKQNVLFWYGPELRGITSL